MKHIYTLLVFCLAFLVNAQVLISDVTDKITIDSPINTQAALELESIDKGFLITRLSDPEAQIITPETGMMLYDSTQGCYVVRKPGEWTSCVLKEKPIPVTNSVNVPLLELNNTSTTFIDVPDTEVRLTRETMSNILIDYSFVHRFINISTLTSNCGSYEVQIVSKEKNALDYTVDKALSFKGVALIEDIRAHTSVFYNLSSTIPFNGTVDNNYIDVKVQIRNNNSSCNFIGPLDASRGQLHRLTRQKFSYTELELN